MSVVQTIIEIVMIFLSFVSAAFAYFKFFREGEHKHRIQSYKDRKGLGVVGSERIVEIASVDENKLNVGRRFDDIHFIVRGSEEGNPLSGLIGHESRLAFPKSLAEVSLVPQEMGYLKNLSLFIIGILLLTGCVPLSNHSYDFINNVSNSADLDKCNGVKADKDDYIDKYLSMHTIFIDSDGEPLKYESGEFVRYDKDSEKNTNNFKVQIERILTNIDKFFESDPEKKKILIYIHGGLNTHKESLKLDAKRVCRMASSKNEVRYYPIFINWDSEPSSSLWEHFIFVRQGKHHDFIGPISSPIIVLEDFGKIPIMAIQDLFYQFVLNDFNTAGKAEKNYDSTCPQTLKKKWLNWKYESEYNAINALYCAAQTKLNMNVSLDEVEDKPKFQSKIVKPAMYFLTLPTKLVLTPIVAELGRPAWDMMVRRTTTMFSKPEEFDLRNKLDEDDDKKNLDAAEKNLTSPHTGALATFLDELNKEAKWHPNREVVLIGHSMGTIVINNVIRSRKYINNLNISGIVYMGAACSIRDFSTAVVPMLQEQEEFNRTHFYYLSSHSYNEASECNVFDYQHGSLLDFIDKCYTNPTHNILLSHKTKFYNLTLHPISEASERNVFDLVQRGSLLEWIDNFYTNPTHNIDRTLGKWRNTIQSLHVIPEEIRSRVTIKGFGYGDKNLYGPQKHSDFNDFNTSDDNEKENTWNFWDEDFWAARKYRYWMPERK